MTRMERVAEKMEKINKRKGNIQSENIKGWIVETNRIYEEIVSWIDPLLKSKLVSIKEDVIVIKEESCEYKVPILSLHGKRWTIYLHPVSWFTISSQGRIDITCAANSVMLLLHGKQWDIAEKRERGFVFQKLDEELFAEIMDVMIFGSNDSWTLRNTCYHRRYIAGEFTNAKI